MKQLLMLLPCLAVLTLQCKKSENCPSQDHIPEYNLSSEELELNPYPQMSQVVFIRINGPALLFNMSQSQTTYTKVLADGIASSDECKLYKAAYEEQSVFLQSPSFQQSLSVRQYRSPDAAYDHKIAIELGDIKNQFNIQTYKTIIGIIPADQAAFPVTIPSMTIQGKVYTNVYASSYTYVPGGTRPIKTDSIYYTWDNGIIRAADSNGEVYELQWWN